MKYIDKAFEIAKELAKVLRHNRELLDSEEDLGVVIGARYGIPMEDAYREGIEEGKSSVIVNDLTPLQPDISGTKTWN